MAKFELTYDFNGGIGEAIASAQVEEGENITLPGGEGITKSGFDFGGWSESIGGEAVGAGYIMPGADTTLYTIWTAEEVPDVPEETAEYTLVYVVNGGKGNPPAEVKVESGAAMPLPDGTGMSYGVGTKDERTFGGWSESPGGEPVKTGAKMPEGNKWLFAVWNQKFKLTFDINEGSGPVPEAIMVGQRTIPEFPDEVTFVKTGYTFGGWAETSGGEAIDTEAFVMPGKNLRLFAVWTPNEEVVISYNVNGGTGNAPVPLKGLKGTSGALSIRTGFAYAGMDFVGWSESAEGDEPLVSPIVLDKNKTLYAIWITEETPAENQAVLDQIIEDARLARDSVDPQLKDSAQLILRVTSQEKMEGLRSGKAVRITYRGFSYVVPSRPVSEPSGPEVIDGDRVGTILFENRGPFA